MNTQTHLEVYEQLKDLASASHIRADRRVQLVMPKLVVDLLAREFPKSTRSKIITDAALELLIRKFRIDHPELEHWAAEEQYDLDRMWAYLSERDRRQP